MIVSLDNKLIFDNGSMVGFNIGVLEDAKSPDFSRYIANTSATTCSITTDITTCEYIALAGVDFASGTTINFRYKQGGAWFSDAIYTIDNVLDETKTIMHAFSVGSGKEDYQVYITKPSAGAKCLISYVAAGEVWELPHGGEEGGFPLVWSVNNVNRRTQTFKGLPTASAFELSPIKASLSFRNLSISDVNNYVYKFNRYAESLGFFYFDESGSPLDRSVYAFDCKPRPIVRHDETRNLMHYAGIDFKTWAGRLRYYVL